MGIHTVNIPKKGQFLRLTCPFSELTAEITIF